MYENEKAQAASVDPVVMRVGWRPVESAPVDGRRVLAWCKEWTGPLTVSFSGADGWVCHCDHRLKYQPTHWMELPQLPTA